MQQSFFSQLHLQPPGGVFVDFCHGNIGRRLGLGTSKRVHELRTLRVGGRRAFRGVRMRRHGYIKKV